MRHGFLRSANGKFTSYDIPGEAIPSQACYVTCLNALGEVTAPYVDQGGILHGYLRKPSGQIVKFDAPGAVNGTYPLSINAEGAIIGPFWDTVSTEHGFLRSQDGSFTTIDVPGAAATEPATNNAAVRSWETTSTLVACTTASCAPGAERSSRLTFPALAQTPARAPFQDPSIMPGRSQVSTVTRLRVTGSSDNR